MNNTIDTLLRALDRYWHSFITALPRFVMAILLLIIGYFIINFLIKIFRKQVTNKAHDPLMSNFLAKTVKLLFVIILGMLALNVAGFSGIAGGLLATAGASAVIVGFAFKDIAENFIAGIILAFNRPFRVNDTIQIDTTFGKVKMMQFRYTLIHTFDGKNVYIPNSDILTKPVYNFTEDGFFRMDFIVGIAYENSIEEGKKVIQKVLDECPEVVHDEEHINFVAEEELATNTVNLKVYFWVHTDDFRRGALQSKGILIQNIKNALEQNNFYLPCNIVELKQYGIGQSEKYPVSILNNNSESIN